MGVDVPSDGCSLERLDGGVAVITIQNARRRNSLSAAVEEQLLEHLQSLAGDDSCRAVVLTGEGGYFSAGGDISRMASTTATAVAAVRRLQEIVVLIDELPAPVVAAIEGGAAGGGLAIATACDFVVAATDARLAMAFDRIGLAPDLGAMYTFERRIGLPATRRLAYLGGRLDAAEAHRLGLVDQLGEPGSVIDDAIALATDIATRSPTANTTIKRTLARPVASLRESLAVELEAAPALYESAEYLAFVRSSGR